MRQLKKHVMIDVLKVILDFLSVSFRGGGQLHKNMHKNLTKQMSWFVQYR